MQRPVLKTAIALFFAFSTGFVFAAQPDRDNNNPPGIERTPRPAPVRRFNVNEPNRPGDANQQPTDQLRQQARERMRRRAMESMMARGEGNTPDFNAAMRERMEARRRQMATPENREAMIQQRKAATEEGINQTEARHRERIARLNRIRELAKKQGDTETAAKADGLLEKETKLYDTRVQRLERRKNMILESENKTPAVKDINQPPAKEK